MSEGWNPDAVAPPAPGGVYEREARDSRLLGLAMRLSFYAAAAIFAALMWRA